MNESIPSTEGDNRLAVAVILGLSAIVLGFLFWFIYGRGTSVYEDAAPDWAVNLPAVNASLNALSATLVLGGLLFIKRGLKKQHAAMMIAAIVSSAAFLVTYLIYHYFAKHTEFSGEGSFRTGPAGPYQNSEGDPCRSGALSFSWADRGP